MKKLIIAAIALVGLNAASFAQAGPVKKTDATKMQVVKKAADNKQQAPVVSMNKPVKTVPATAAVKQQPVVKTATATAAVTKTTPASPIKKEVKKAATTSIAKNTSAAPLKKDGTPDKRFAANKHLKADGTPDMRYKANKHS